MKRYKSIAKNRRKQLKGLPKVKVLTRDLSNEFLAWEQSNNSSSKKKLFNFENFTNINLHNSYQLLCKNKSSRDKIQFLETSNGTTRLIANCFWMKCTFFYCRQVLILFSNIRLTFFFSLTSNYAKFLTLQPFPQILPKKLYLIFFTEEGGDGRFYIFSSKQPSSVETPSYFVVGHF